MSQTFERGLDCLLAIASSKTPLSIEEIASLTHLPASSVYRLLRPLEKRHLVERSENGRRALGPAILALCGSARSIHGSEIVDIALPFLREVAKATQETVLLTTFLGLDVICMEAIPSPQPIRLSPQKGLLQNACSGCSSKVLLAYAPPDLQQQILDKCGCHRRFNGQQVTPDLLRRELEQIRQDGYSVTIEEVDPGAAGVAAPIFGKDNQILAGLTVAGPLYRFESGRLEEMIAIAVSAAKKISQRCGLSDAPAGEGYRNRIE